MACKGSVASARRSPRLLGFAAEPMPRGRSHGAAIVGCIVWMRRRPAGGGRLGPGWRRPTPISAARTHSGSISALRIRRLIALLFVTPIVSRTCRRVRPAGRHRTWTRVGRLDARSDLRSESWPCCMACTRSDPIWACDIRPELFLWIRHARLTGGWIHVGRG
jgi:hypothetical protein